MGRVSDAKERLMDAVLELIWTGSYGSTTIDQICDKAGVKKGSFYYFFESKADLAVAALDESSVALCLPSAPRSAHKSRSCGRKFSKFSRPTASILNRLSATPMLRG